MLDHRGLAVNKLKSILENDRLASNLEICVFNDCIDKAEKDGLARYWENIKFARLYMGRIRGLVFNLTNRDNPDLLQRVKSKQLPVKRLVAMSHIEMFPEHWRETLERVAFKRLNAEVNMRKNEEDGAIQCSKCKSWKTVYYQLQTRSADEPMTTFVTCTNCTRRWKF